MKKLRPNHIKPGFSERFPDMISGRGRVWVQLVSQKPGPSHLTPGSGAGTTAAPTSLLPTFNMKQLTLLLAIFSLGSAEIATFSLPSPWSYTCDRSEQLMSFVKRI